MNKMKNMPDSSSGVGTEAGPSLQACPVLTKIKKLQTCIVVTEKMKPQQPRDPEGQAAGPPQVMEFTMYHPYTQMELVDLGEQFVRNQESLWQLGC